MTLADFQARWTGHVPGIQDITRAYGVLVPLVEGPEGLSLLFAVRADTLGRQPGEVCFPGGKVEPGEEPRHCAIRESWEELGIPSDQVDVIGPLDLVVHPGRFVLYPFLGVLSSQAMECLQPNPDEVKETFLVPVSWLTAHPPEIYTYQLNPQVGEDFPYERIGFPDGYRWRGGEITVPIYAWPEHPIWGLTGRMVRNLMEGMK